MKGFRGISVIYAGLLTGRAASGSVTRDDNRGISSIEYNLLGLPSRISVGSGSSIEYIYSADGTKLGSRYTEGRAASYALEAEQTEQTAQPYAYISEDYDYIGCYEFRNRNLFRVNTPYGYYLAGEFTPYMRDYQGNNRNEADYYAYGLPTSDSDVKSYDPYLYGDKMLYTLKGLNIYDFLARTYAPDIARFMQPDPKAGNYHWLSPYAYCGGDPINFVDPDGQVLVAESNGVAYTWSFTLGYGWGFYDSDGNLYEGDDLFMANLTASLIYIMTSDTGKALVKDICDHENILTVRKHTKSVFDANQNMLGWNTSKDQKVPTQKGAQSDINMDLAHELAHAKYTWNGGEKKTWFSYMSGDKYIKVGISEIYTTHIENMIRGELDLPLRTFYSINEYGKPFGKPILKHGSNESLYFTISGETTFKKLGKGTKGFIYR